MRVILRDNIENLGKKGDIVNVAPGYGRNYLIPKKMAIEVTSSNMKMIAIEQKALQKGFEKEKASYQELIDRLNAVTLSFVRKASEKDVIFGSVSSTDIRDALVAQGFEVEKRKIMLDEPIKRLGNYTVPIKIFHEERAEVRLEVLKEGEPSTKKEQGPDLVEGGEAVTAPGKEEAKPPVTEEKKEDIQERPAVAAAESESGPAAKEVIRREAEEIPEGTKEAPQETETQDSAIVGEGPVSEKEAPEKPSAKGTEGAPLDADDEPLDAQKTAPEKKPKGSAVIPAKLDTTPEKPESGSEDAPDLSEATEKESEKAKKGAEELGGPAEEDDGKEAANKDNK